MPLGPRQPAVKVRDTQFFLCYFSEGEELTQHQLQARIGVAPTSRRGLPVARLSVLRLSFSRQKALCAT